LAFAVLAWTAAGLVSAESGRALLPPAPLRQAVAVVAKGVVWFDDGPVSLNGFSSGSSRLGVIDGPGDGLPHMASSATGVAVVRDGEENAGAGGVEFLGGVPPSPLVAIAQPRIMRGAGCKGWLPGGEFVVAGDELVAAGECQWDDRSVRQPLYIRSLHRGPWRVLRWLPDESSRGADGLYFNDPPVLAAEGDLIAAGTRYSSADMQVSIIDVHSARVEARFNLPDGYLAFAANDRLVLSVPVLPSREGNDFPLGSSTGNYRLALYSTRGRHLRELGSAQQPPLVSGMHLVTDEGQTVSVRSVTGGPPKPVISFDRARELLTLAFRWPALVVVEMTSTPLLPSEIHCWSSEYSPAGEPFLGIFDLAKSEPFLPAPALVHVGPSEPLADCGPAPP
jgi:hypothetical protein